MFPSLVKRGALPLKLGKAWEVRHSEYLDEIIIAKA